MPQINTLLIDIAQPADVKANKPSSMKQGKSGGDEFSKMVEQHLSSEKSGNNQSRKANRSDETSNSKPHHSGNREVDAQKSETNPAENALNTRDADNEGSNGHASDGKEFIVDEMNADNKSSATENVDETEQSQQFLTLLTESGKVLRNNDSAVNDDLEVVATKESVGKTVDEQASLKLLLEQQKNEQGKLEGNAASYQGGNKDDIAKAMLKQDQLAGKNNFSKEASEVGATNGKYSEIAKQATAEEIIGAEGGSAKNVKTTDELAKDKSDTIKAQQLAASLLSGKTTEPTDEAAKSKAEQSQLSASIEILKAQSALMDKETKAESKQTSSAIGSAGKVADLKAVDDVPVTIRKNEDKILEGPLNTAVSRATADGLNFVKQSAVSINSAATPTVLPENTMSKSTGSDSEFIESNNLDSTESLELEQELSQQNAGSDNNAKEQPTANKAFGANPLFGGNAEAGIHSVSGQERQEQLLNMIDNQIANEKIQSVKNTNVIGQEIIAIHSKDFSGAVKDKVMFMINQKLQQVEIRLDPPELGSMHIRLNLQNEQAVVNFVVQNQQAKEAVEENLAKLKEMLAESGIDVGESNVEQQGQQADNSGFGQSSNSKGKSFEDGMSDSQTSIIHRQVVNASASGVDYYA
ncbi:MAG: flagellar hook-length control protein FliK [Alteromonadaceae bacterium]|nr:flagellar hook-length control protein FliK [Alteromonadaceae bacterium]